MSELSSLENPNLETQVEFLCLDTVNFWRNILGDLAKKYDISHLERRIILSVGRFPSICQADLAAYLNVEPQSLTRTLESMEQKHWLKKSQSTTDKRSKYLNLDEEGKLKLIDVLKIGDEIRVKVLKNVSEDEKNIMVKVLTEIKNNLKRI